jgi:hypothetical protein
MAGVQAPICYINPPAPTAEPLAPTIPAIPPATDLQSALAAIAALTQIVRALASQFPVTGGGRITDLTVIPAKKKNNFYEVVQKRTVKKVRVTNPNNPSQFVDVNQITGLTFENKLTKQQIDWSQGDPSIPDPG